MKDQKMIACQTGEVVFSYHDYLKTNHWRSFRLRCIRLNGNHCTDCGQAKPLQIHHLHYNTIGNEDYCDVLPLCNDCHRARHLDKKSKKKTTCNGYKNITDFISKNESELFEMIIRNEDWKSESIRRYKKTKTKKLSKSKRFRKLIKLANIARSEFSQ